MKMTPDLKAKDGVLQNIVDLMDELESKQLKGSVTVAPLDVEEAKEEAAEEEAPAEEPSDEEDVAKLRAMALR
jgi:hypothetical protein